MLFHCTSPDSFLFHTYTIQSQSQFNLNKVCLFFSSMQTVADEVDPELLAKVLANAEMRALLNSLAKTMK